MNDFLLTFILINGKLYEIGNASFVKRISYRICLQILGASARPDVYLTDDQVDYSAILKNNEFISYEECYE